jgi:glycosyltransferase involved in cell wall biosynthesis
VVVVGDGPLRRHLQRRLPGVAFLGFRSGSELSEAFASLDLFVHTGADETFCQAAQEALASGVPVVAPAAGGLPDLVRLEVSDKLTLRWLGPWARAAGIPAVVVSHERLDQLVDLWLPRSGSAARAVAAWNRRLAASFDRVVCTTGWAAEEFLRLGAGNVDRVPLGVDLEAFAPDRASARLRRRLAPDGGPLLVHAGRLAREKRPELAVATLKGVLERWPRARLVFAGAGPLRPSLSALAGGLPVEFLGFVADRRELAALLATADLVLAPGPVETFGLTALESPACGTPVVAARTGALPELLAAAEEGAGLAVHPCGPAMAAAAATVLAWDPARRRVAARRRPPASRGRPRWPACSASTAWRGPWRGPGDLPPPSGGRRARGAAAHPGRHPGRQADLPRDPRPRPAGCSASTPIPTTRRCGPAGCWRAAPPGAAGPPW